MDKVLCVIGYNIRSARNIGAIFRTADGAGVKKIYLSGYSPCPYSGIRPYPTQAEKMVAKTALGAEKVILWEKAENIENLILNLKKENFKIYALEKTDASRDVFLFDFRFPCALILGNETDGVSEEILKMTDAVLFIPMRGWKESLNVSVAAGIAMYQILK